MSTPKKKPVKKPTAKKPAPKKPTAPRPIPIPTFDPEQDERVMASFRERMMNQVAEQVQGILKQDFETRVHEAMAQTLLEAANRSAEQNVKFVTGHLLAGCEQKDVPSSARVMNEVVVRLRKLATEQVSHPLPTH